MKTPDIRSAHTHRHPSIHQFTLLLLTTLMTSIAIGAAPVRVFILPHDNTNNAGVFTVRLHPTLPGTNYVLISSESLAHINWQIERYIIGQELDNFTDTTITLNGRSSFFLSAGSGEDSDGDGLPDAYEETILGTDPENFDSTENGAGDGYADLDEDGWSNMRELENGSNPLVFDIPPPPSWLSVEPGPGPTTVTIEWDPSPALVLGYVIERWDPETGSYYPIGEVDADTTKFEFETQPEGGSGGAALTVSEDWYRVAGVFPGGFSITTPPLRIADPAPPAPFTSLIRGRGNQWFLHVGPIPERVQHVRVRRTIFDETLWQEVEIETRDLPAHSATNGFIPLPPDLAPFYEDSRYLTGFVDSNNTVGGLAYAQHTDGSRYGGGPLPWIDGTAHIKENVHFILRAATENIPFSYDARWDSGSEDYAYRPDYVFAGFSKRSRPSQRLRLSPFQPLIENHLWKNFSYDPGRISPRNGMLTNGVSPGFNGWQLRPPAYVFDQNSFIAGIPHPPQLGTNTFLSFPPTGISTTTTPAGSQVTMAPERRNLYGLRYQSTLVTASARNEEIDVYTLTGGQSLDIDRTSLYFYPAVEDPVLETVGYYAGVLHYESVLREGDLLPGETGFTPDMTTPVLIAPVGDDTTVTAWARKRIRNGNPDTAVFVQQYFENAFRADNLGFRTFTPSGFLTETGEYFPTESGPMALITRPDPDQDGDQATVLVHAFNLEADRNHDGTIDPYLGGPDSTTYDQPLRFWINNDYDGTGLGVDALRPALADYFDDRISSLRDLEDFARLQISGLPDLPASEGYSVTLSWNHGFGPTINLFHALEPTGGTGYRDQETVAARLFTNPTGLSNHVVRLTEDTIYTFPDDYFATGEKKHFLFEGVSEGSGTLARVWRHGKAMATAKLNVELHNVRKMYESAHIKNVNLRSPRSANFLEPSESRYQNDSSSPRSSTESREIIVLVHGWRTTQHEFETAADTYFKRLWWAGYQGRFAALRWPTPTRRTAGVIFPIATFNRSEYVAFKSAPAVNQYLLGLTTRFPSYSINLVAHSQGGIMIMEALRRQAAAGISLVNNCAFLQAAVPAHCFDPNHPGVPLLIVRQPHTPDTYRNYAAGIGNAVSGKIVNFYNPLDYALTTGTFIIPVDWEANQTRYKPDQGFGYETTATTATHNGQRQVTDPHELMSFCARSRSMALGAEAVAGEIDANVNTWQQFGFGETSMDHNGQVNRPIQSLNGFFRELLIQLGTGQPGNQ